MKTHCTILHADDASQWCTYVKKLFAKDMRQNLSIDSINIDELEYENPPQVELAVRNSYLVIVLTSPDMTTFILDKASWFLPLVSNISQGTSLAILLCYVSVEDFKNSIKDTYGVLVDKRCDVIANDPKENRIIVAEYIDIIDKNEQQTRRPTPKKRKERLSPQQTSIVKEVSPNKVYRAKEHVIVACSTPLEGTLQVGFVGDSEVFHTKSLNPYTFRFKTPNKPPGSYKLQVFQDGKEIHQQPFYYMSPHESAFQSASYLQQVFKVKDTEGLDHALVDIMERSLSEDGSLTFLFQKIQNCVLEGTTKSAAEIPTLLHFAAANGLSEFCALLLDVPGSVVAFQIENNSGLNPSELADSRGHHELAEFIRDFMETKAVLTTCDMYIRMAHGNDGDQIESNYIAMGGIVQDGGNMEEPYSTAEDIRLAKHNTRLTPARTAPEKPKPHLPPIPSRARTNSATTEPVVVRPGPEEIAGDTLLKSQRAADFMGMSKQNGTTNSAAFGKSNQEELIQIMESVKKGDFNTDDALKLFSDWKEKNKGEESNSFKKKKENLKQMRKNYSKIWLATETTADEVYNRTGGNLLQRMLSKKGTKKRQPRISEPYQTRSPNSLISIRESERFSSSSNSSRDSNASGADVFYSDNDHSDDDPAVVVRRSSAASRMNDKRNSRMIMFLESTENLDGECPPLPPRTYTRRQ
ncbi:uncharacterized protein LOC121379199 [Gigantopelta aegis]|uniref:uncharacterized protein LOC121379199 n=1 Tax=Gigantopelta aegis TaxID=1735272 RepID=UPI001B88B28A|nr:uncharacterized protein LOC121379199 [Gigantopelta aegis]